MICKTVEDLSLIFGTCYGARQQNHVQARVGPKIASVEVGESKGKKAEVRENDSQARKAKEVDWKCRLGRIERKVG